ncbi:hypothetical protein C0Q70_19022 [Pomacea canaliculata]|uniref:Uncharacterized protein n=1 Tax=Pomacea canaliculata TaxID=400727 RepID=A0A2T7NI62_POMCA|nr:hypothetical protein C0Q70_19022 [Pomacea canaliculata]
MEEIAEEMLCSEESEDDEIEEEIVPFEEAQRAWSTVLTTEKREARQNFDDAFCLKTSAGRFAAKRIPSSSSNVDP